MTQTDEILVDASRAGDRNAYSDLVRRHLKRVFAICLSLLGEVADAEDATQEVFLRGFEGIRSLRDTGRFGSWIGQIALSFATAIAEAEKQLDVKHDRYDDAAGKDLASLLSVRSACSFYGDLLAAEKDVAYYGDEVTVRDHDRVLLRWRLDDEQYRVIYGDMRSETVSVSRLTELETRD
jgi:hypothetical protein